MNYIEQLQRNKCLEYWPCAIFFQKDFWTLKRNYFPIGYCQGMNVSIHFLKLGILGTYAGLMFWTEQRENTVSFIKFTPSVLSSFIVLPYLPLKYQHCLSKTKMLCLAAFHLFNVFSGTGTTSMWSNCMLFFTWFLFL